LSTDVKRLLRQLNQKELLALAQRKKAKVSDKTPKPKLLDILSAIVSKRDIQAFFAKPGRTGAYAALDGAIFEKKCLAYLNRLGYKCQIGDVQIKGMEFDVTGTKTTGRILKKTCWVVAECKNKPTVVMQDFDKFLGKFTHFARKHPNEEVRGFLITSGVFDPLVKKTASAHHELKLLRIKRGNP